MSTFPTVSLIILSFICIFYICYTRHYYTYCAYSKAKGDYILNLNEIENEEITKELYMDLCNDVFKDLNTGNPGNPGNPGDPNPNANGNNSANSSIMKSTINLAYSFIVNTDRIINDEKEVLRIKAMIKETGYYSMRFEMKLLKIVHLALYIEILFYFVICFPRLIIDLVVYLFNKTLVIMFLVLIVEAIANLYLDLNVDLLKIVQRLGSFIPVNLVSGIVFNVMREVWELLLSPNNVRPNMNQNFVGGNPVY